MNKKILILTSLFYPDTFGGGEKVLYYQAKELLKHGYQVTVLTRKNKPGLKNEELFEGMKVIRYEFGFSRYFGKSLADFLFLGKKVRKLLTAEKFDLVISHYAFSSYGFYRAKVKLPSLYVFHASYYREVLLEGLARKFRFAFIGKLANWFFAGLVKYAEAKSLGFFDLIIVLSHYSRQILQETYQIAETKIIIIPAGVALQTFIPAQDKQAVRNKLHLPTDKFIIFTVRRLVGRMGLENLISAAALLKQKLPDFLLIIGGQGILETQLKQMAQSLGLENNLVFAGFISDRDLPLYYQATDIFVLPTLAFEGFGLVTLEALASGTPVLGTPIGATPEILSQLNHSFIFKSNEPADMAAGIINFWQNRNLQANQNLSQRLRTFVEQNYSWEMAGDLLVTEIENLVSYKFNK